MRSEHDQRAEPGAAPRAVILRSERASTMHGLDVATAGPSPFEARPVAEHLRVTEKY
jgi:hypothetical protein